MPARESEDFRQLYARSRCSRSEWMIRFSTKVLVKEEGLSDRSYPSLFLLLLKLCTKVIEASGFVTRAKLMVLLLRLLRTFGIRRSKG
ncbi:unnamed protein product [Cuscuta campestris]|uniref:Uncharacterized protein n=1 Tax=Cuscuta campestris TaxID=132261 RepID=A0A484NC28_9ASTE|nr:unnamed protein product [Cuscuta campestris]